MTPRELLEAFETLADAPDGVKRLRELVLQLAVQGKLLWREAASSNGDSQKIPTHWTLRKLSELTLDFQNGLATRGGDGPPVVVLRLADIKKGRISDGPFRHINIPIGEARKYELFENDILAIRVNGSGDLVGRLIRIDRAAGWAYCDHLIRLRLRTDAILPEFLVLFGDTHQAREHLSSVTITTAGQRTVNQKGLGSLVVPLPPLAEQRRIVARVDELMGLLDRLEAARAARDEVRHAARDAALAALREAEDTEAVESVWARISDQMDTLFETPADVAPLRQTIIQLAIRGTLVTEQSGENSAIDLDRIATTRRNSNARWTRLPAVSVPEMSFSAPKKWVWARMDDVCAIAGGVTKGRDLEGRGLQSYPYLRVANVQAGHVDLRIVKEIEIPAEDFEQYRLQAGDVLLTEGGDWDKLGRSAIWGGEIEECIHQNHVFRARSLTPQISSRWISLFTNSPDGRSYFQSCSKQTTNLASINMTQLKACPLPVPPLAEQQSIIAKVDTLMALCEDLEVRLAAARDLQAQFAAAAVHHLDV